MQAQQFPFVARDPTQGAASLAPMLPISLASAERRITTAGLLDTGATVNVLPYQTGVQLGFQWNSQRTEVRLSGNLALIEARVVLLSASVQPFSPVRMAFAWAKTDELPIVLGQVNFFLEFDACFFRSQGYFDLRPKNRI